MTPDAGDRGGLPLWRFARLALTAVVIASAAFLLWTLRDALMMAFGAVVVAVLLLGLADLLRRYLPLPHRWGVAAATAIVLLVILGLGWMIGAQVKSQFAELWERLPLGVQEIEERLGFPLLGGAGADGDGIAPFESGRDPPEESMAPSSRDEAGGAAEEGGAGAGQSGEGEGQAAGGTTTASDLWGWVASYGFPVVNAVFGTILVIIAGVYLAMEPATYQRGLVKLFPVSQHARIDDTLSAMGRALRYWLLGELIAMVIIGLLVGLGAWALGLPAPIALGVFAGMTEFVPIVGPIVGAVPGVLLALTEGGMMVLWAVLLYTGIQQIESNLIAPLVQERMVRLPPAAFLLAVIVFGGIFGILGVIFAAPLAVVCYVAIQKLWVREALNEETFVTGEGDR